MKGDAVSTLRLDKIVNVSEDELRKGDVLLLQAGDLVPADLKLIDARRLEVDEFDLTGEIMPIDKRVDGEAVLVYRGSRVTGGSGRGVVVATGEETEYGEILKQRWGEVKLESPPLFRRKYLILPLFLLLPLLIFLNSQGNPPIIWVIGIVTALFIVLLQNSELFDYLLFLREIKGLKRQNVQITDETSLGNLADVDLACFDKTGVLTTRDIKVKSIHFADETPDLSFFKSDRGISNLTNMGFALCNDVIFLEKLGQADPIDRALISFASKNETDLNELATEYKRIYEKPFDSEDRYMACGFEHKRKRIHFAKGDPEIVLEMCSNYVTISGLEKARDADFLLAMKEKTFSSNQNGDRTIALAYSTSNSETQPPHFTFLCLVQLENPAKPDAARVVETLREKGIRSIILTGDRPETALKIAGEIGIGSTSKFSLTGKHMDGMPFSEIARQSDYVSVFSRLLPSHKGIIVMLLKQRHKSVAMVGDGANDTVALRVADVGISFLEDSSPFAKRVSKILINDLSDLLTIILSAKRAKWRSKWLALFRGTLIASILLISYAMVFS